MAAAAWAAVAAAAVAEATRAEAANSPISVLPDWLTCGSHDRGPQVAGRVELTRAGDRRAYRQVDQLVVPVSSR